MLSSPPAWAGPHLLTIDLRRHALTKKPSGRGEGSHLSQDGVSAARRIGASIGPFGYVLVSDVAYGRTGSGMGFAVNAGITMGGDESMRRVTRSRTIAVRRSRAVRCVTSSTRGGPVAAAARRQEQLWRHAVAQHPTERRDRRRPQWAHRAGVVAFLPSPAASAWRGPFGHLEGERLTFADDNDVRSRYCAWVEWASEVRYAPHSCSISGISVRERLAEAASQDRPGRIRAWSDRR